MDSATSVLDAYLRTICDAGAQSIQSKIHQTHTTGITSSRQAKQQSSFRKVIPASAVQGKYGVGIPHNKLDSGNMTGCLGRDQSCATASAWQPSGQSPNTIHRTESCSSWRQAAALLQKSNHVYRRDATARQRLSSTPARLSQLRSTLVPSPDQLTGCPATPAQVCVCAISTGLVCVMHMVLVSAGGVAGAYATMWPALSSSCGRLHHMCHGCLQTWLRDLQQIQARCSGDAHQLASHAQRVHLDTQATSAKLQGDAQDWHAADARSFCADASPAKQTLASTWPHQSSSGGQLVAVSPGTPVTNGGSRRHVAQHRRSSEAQYDDGCSTRLQQQCATPEPSLQPAHNLTAMQATPSWAGVRAARPNTARITPELTHCADASAARDLQDADANVSKTPLTDCLRTFFARRAAADTAMSPARPLLTAMNRQAAHEVQRWQQRIISRSRSASCFEARSHTPATGIGRPCVNAREIRQCCAPQAASNGAARAHAPKAIDTMACTAQVAGVAALRRRHPHLFERQGRAEVMLLRASSAAGSQRPSLRSRTCSWQRSSGDRWRSAARGLSRRSLSTSSQPALGTLPSLPLHKRRGTVAGPLHDVSAQGQRSSLHVCHDTDDTLESKPEGRHGGMVAVPGLSDRARRLLANTPLAVRSAPQLSSNVHSQASAAAAQALPAASSSTESKHYTCMQPDRKRSTLDMLAAARLSADTVSMLQSVYNVPGAPPLL